MIYQGLLPEHEKIRQKIEASWNPVQRASRKNVMMFDRVEWQLPEIHAPNFLEEEIAYEQRFPKKTKPESFNYRKKS